MMGEGHLIQEPGKAFRQGQTVWVPGSVRRGVECMLLKQAASSI